MEYQNFSSLKKIKRHNFGFTLIELLVVVAIIGLLSSIVAVALSNGRVKARDARRLTDINQIKSGLELYYDKGGGYPATASWTAVQGTNNPLTCSGESILRVPQDPLNATNPTYAYTYTQVGTAQAGCATNVYLDFKLDFTTEGSTQYGAGGSYCLRPIGITAGVCP